MPHDAESSEQNYSKVRIQLTIHNQLNIRGNASKITQSLSC